jgi:glycerol-3-phosphate acyltransferase PlsY
LDLVLVFVAAVLAYILGSLNFAVILSKLFAHKDVRNFGSGNAGMTNMLRVFGVLPGILTFVFDVLKGFIACYIGRYVIFEYLNANYSDKGFYVPVYGALLCGIFCMLGHVFPVFFGFKGGKAVAVSVGIFLVAHWQAITIALLVFVLLLLITRIISISSLTATVTVFVVTLLMPGQSGEQWVVLLMTFIMCLIVFVKHKDNIVRLIKGEEKPIFGKGKAEK